MAAETEEVSIYSSLANVGEVRLPKGLSLFIFSHRNTLRTSLFNTVEHPYFDMLIFLAIIANAVVMSVDPLDDTQSNASTFDTLSIVFTAIFTVEAVIKIVSYGFLLTPDSYLGNAWNVFDFVLVVFGLMAFAGNESLASFRILRIFRVLRLARHLSKVPTMRIMMSALLRSLPLVRNVLLMLGFMLLVFGVLGLQLFAERMTFRCMNGSTILYDHLCTDNSVSYGYHCPSGLTCNDTGVNPNMDITHFDDIGAAYLAVFQTVTLEGWSDIMYYVDDVTVSGSKIYFVLLVLLGGVFLNNIIVTMMTVRFEAERKLMMFDIHLMENWRANPSLLSYVLERTDGRIRGLIAKLAPKLDVWEYIHDELGAAFSVDLTAEEKDMMIGITEAQPLDRGGTLRDLFKDQAAAAAGASSDDVEMDDLSGPKQPYPLVPPTSFGHYTEPEPEESDSETDDDFEDVDYEQDLMDNPWYWALYLYVLAAEVKKRPLELQCFHIGHTEVPKISADMPTDKDDETHGTQVEYNRHIVDDLLLMNVMRTTKFNSTLPSSLAQQQIDRLFLWARHRPSQISRLREEYDVLERLCSADIPVCSILLCMSHHDVSMRNSLRKLRLLAQQRGRIINNLRMLEFGRWIDQIAENYVDRGHEEPDVVNPCMEITRQWFRHVVQSDWFDVAVALTVVTNVVMLCFNSFDISDSRRDMLVIGSIVFNSIFFVEMACKIIGLGFGGYFGVLANSFDFVLVWIGIAAMVIDKGEPGLLSAMVAFRVLRLFTVLKAWSPLALMIVTFYNSMADLIPFLLLICTFLFAFSALGRRLFHDSFPEGGTVEVPTRFHFSDIGNSALTVFQVMTGDGWNELMYVAVDADRWGGMVFFVALVLCMNFTFLSLLLSVLLTNFRTVTVTRIFYNEAPRGLALVTITVSRVLQLLCCCTPWRQSAPLVADSENEQQTVRDREARAAQITRTQLDSYRMGPVNVAHSSGKQRQVVMRSFNAYMDNIMVQTTPVGHACCMGPESRVRVFLLRMITSRVYLWINFLCVMGGAAVLALWDPDFAIDSVAYSRVKLAERFVMGYFAVEFIIKWMALRLYGKNRSYISSAWRVLELLTLLLAIGHEVTHHTDWFADNSVRYVRALLALRCLRLLGMMNRTRMVVYSMIRSVPAVCAVGGLVGVVLLLFAIIGMNLFKGKLHHCEDLNREEFSTLNKTACLADGKIWSNPAYGNFDNIASALLSCFNIANREGWATLLFHGIDSTDHILAEDKNNRSSMVVYFVVLVTVAGIFAMSLFIASVVYTFSKIYHDLTGDSIDDLHHAFIFTYGQVLDISPTRIRTPMVPQGSSRWRRKLFRFVIGSNPDPGKTEQIVAYTDRDGRQRLRREDLNRSNNYFDMFILMCIVLNVLFIAVDSPDLGQDTKDILSLANTIFTWIFVAEMVLKHICLGFNGYWKDPWNAFDGVLVCLTMVETIIAYAVGNVNVGFDLSIFRLFRCLRVLRLIGKAENARKTIMTVYRSVPGALHIILMWLVFVFGFSIASMVLFADIKLDTNSELAGLDDHVNFTSFTKSFMTWVLVSTGERWTSIMHAVAVEEPYCTPNVDCGFPKVAYSMFILFRIFVSLMFLNMLIGILLKNFEIEAKARGVAAVVTPYDLDMFALAWKKFNPASYVQVDPLMMTLPRLRNFLRFFLPAFYPRFKRTFLSLADRIREREVNEGKADGLIKGGRLPYVQELDEMNIPLMLHDVFTSRDSVHFVHVLEAMMELMVREYEPTFRRHHLSTENERYRAMRVRLSRMYPKLDRSFVYLAAEQEAVTVISRNYIRFRDRRRHQFNTDWARELRTKIRLREAQFGLKADDDSQDVVILKRLDNSPTHFPPMFTVFEVICWWRYFNPHKDVFFRALHPLMFSSVDPTPFVTWGRGPASMYERDRQAHSPGEEKTADDVAVDFKSEEELVELHRKRAAVLWQTQSDPSARAALGLRLHVIEGVVGDNAEGELKEQNVVYDADQVPDAVNGMDGMLVLDPQEYVRVDGQAQSIFNARPLDSMRSPHAVNLPSASRPSPNTTPYGSYASPHVQHVQGDDEKLQHPRQSEQDWKLM